MKTIVVLVCLTVAALAADSPATDEIVARMMERDAARREALRAYSVTSKYVLQNKGRHAEMLVLWTRQADGTKAFSVLSEEGDAGVRNHVFHKLLEAEVEASRPDQQARARITPDNYSFQLTGVQDLDGHRAFVIEIEPRRANKYLTRGRIWVAADDFAVIRVEGAPARCVSFWTKSVSFVQTFEKNGAWWLPASNRSETDARLFGPAELAIEYSDYRFEKLAPAEYEIAAR